MPSASIARGRITSSSSSRQPEAISELEHSLLITEEVLRHLVTRDDRPVKASRRDGGADDGDIDIDIDAGPPSEDAEEEDDTELIDESESEAAPAAID